MASAQEVTLSLFTYGFRGGAPPYRGYHLNGESKRAFPCDTKVSDLENLLQRQGNEKLLFFKGNAPERGEDISQLRFSDPSMVVSDLAKEGIFLALMVPFRPGMSDIGVWGSHVESVGHEILSSNPAALEVCSKTQASEILSSFRYGVDAVTSPVQHDIGLNLLSAEERATLIQYLDSAYANEATETHDLKLVITLEELTQLCSPESIARLSEHFDEPSFTVKLRRVQATTDEFCINFHLDASLRTMQICLNDESEYVGGHVVYATAQGFFCPSRPAGATIIHDSSIPHGVTALTSGTRYSLFFLKERV